MLFYLNVSYEAIMWSMLEGMLEWSYLVNCFMKLAMRSMLRIMHKGLMCDVMNQGLSMYRC